MATSAPVRRGHPVRIGFTVGATNPKTIVFFVAFLPQFTDPTGAVAAQTVLLGVVFGVMARRPTASGHWPPARPAPGSPGGRPGSTPSARPGAR